MQTEFLFISTVVMTILLLQKCLQLTQVMGIGFFSSAMSFVACTESSGTDVLIFKYISGSSELLRHLLTLDLLLELLEWFFADQPLKSRQADVVCKLDACISSTFLLSAKM